MKFTSRDYFFAMTERINDSEIMNSSKCSLSYQIYTYGVAIECLLRFKICEYTTEFDAKHDLERLYSKSKIFLDVNEDQKEKLACAIKIANKIWDNNLRYGSQKRMNRYIGEVIVRNNNTKQDYNNIACEMLNEMEEAAKIIVGVNRHE